MSYITPRQAREILGVGDSTLRDWCEQGIIEAIKTPKGTRRYNVSSFIQLQQNKQPISGPTIGSSTRICYCRVSSNKQKDDLQKQVDYMREKYPKDIIITDIGSGINFKRHGLRTILESASKHLITEVVVAYRDRLCRFAFELIEWILQTNGVKLVVLNEVLDSSGTTELAEDLLAIINVFNCRINGQRKYKTKKENKQIEEIRQTDRQHNRGKFGCSQTPK